MVMSHDSDPAVLPLALEYQCGSDHLDVLVFDQHFGSC